MSALIFDSLFSRDLSHLDDDDEHLVTIAVTQIRLFLALSVFLLLFRPTLTSFLFWDIGVAGVLAFVGFSFYRYGPTRAATYSGLLVTECLPQLVASLDRAHGLATSLGVSLTDITILRDKSDADLHWAASVVRLSGYSIKKPSGLTRTGIELALFALGAYVGAWAPTQFPGLSQQLAGSNPLTLILSPLVLGVGAGLLYRLWIAERNRQQFDKLLTVFELNLIGELSGLGEYKYARRREALQHHLSVATAAALIGPERQEQLAALGVDLPVPRRDAIWKRLRAPPPDDHSLSLLQFSFGVYLSLVLPPLLGYVPS